MTFIIVLEACHFWTKNKHNSHYFAFHTFHYTNFIKLNSIICNVEKEGNLRKNIPSEDLKNPTIVISEERRKISTHFEKYQLKNFNLLSNFKLLFENHT